MSKKRKKRKSKQEKVVEEPQKKPYLKLGLLGSAALLAVLGSYTIFSVASKNETKASQAAVSEKDLLDRIREYATVEPAREIDPNKPFCFYIGQTHIIHSGSGFHNTSESSKNQVTIFHILSDLVKGDDLEAVYVEGWKGKYVRGTPSSKTKKLINEASDAKLAQALMRNSRLNAGSLLFSATGFDDIYGFSRKDPIGGRKRLEQVLNRLESINKRLIDSKAANWPLRLSLRRAIQHKEDLYSLASDVNEVPVDSVENIQSLPGYGTGNIAVIIGGGHIPDLKQMDSEGKLEGIHKRYNVAYVLTPGYIIPPKEHDPKVESLKSAKIMEDLIKEAESKNEKLVRIY